MGARTAPRITVVVCTMASRAEHVGRCLESLAAARGARDHEVLVVVERGADLGGVVERFRDRLSLETVRTIERALSPKRNAGLLRATGDVVAYLDDDARVSEGWFRGLERAFADGAGIVAGAIDPDFEVPLPPELAEEPFAIGGFNRYGGREEPDRAIGANCAFRRDLLLAAGPFDVRLGAGSPYLAWGEETEMFRRLAPRRGITFAPDAAVVHTIQAGRLTRGYVLRRARQNGRAQCFVDRLHQPGFGRRSLVVPLLALRAMLTPGWLRGKLRARIRARRLAGYAEQLIRLLVWGTPPIRRGGTGSEAGRRPGG